MAFIQCECGSKIELSSSAMRVTCPGCGQRFTVPQIEEDEIGAGNGASAMESEVAFKPSASYKVAADLATNNGQAREGLSSTMLRDLPMVTQFDQHYAQSILAV